MNDLSRRTFVAAGCLGCGALAAGCATGAAQQNTESLRVPLDDLPVGSSRVFADRQIVVTRTDSAIVAFTAQCTHQGCAVTLTDNYLKCPCHGSRFDPLTGAALRGPATQPLATVPVVVDGQSVVFD